VKHTSPVKSILKTSLPAVVDLSSQTIYWTFEAIIIGRISATALAGVSMAIQVMLVFFAVLLTFVVGASLLINRALGASDRFEANHIFGQAMMMGCVMAVIFALIWYSGGVHIFKLIKETGSASARIAGVTYLRTVAVFAPLLITNFIAVGIIRAVGDTRYSMTTNVFINVINVILSFLVIDGKLGFPNLGVRGCALAVGISHSIGFFITLYLLRSRRLQLFLSFRELATPRWESFKKLFSSGLPTTVEQLAWALGQLVVTSYAAGIYVTVLTIHAIFCRVQAVLSMVYMGFGLTAMSLMGKNLGASNNALAESTARTAQRVMAVFVFVIVTIMVFFSSTLLNIFTKDSATIELGRKAIFIFALAQIPKAISNVLSGNLRGVGELKWLMWTTVIFVVILEIGFNWVAAFILGWGIYGIWGIQAFDETLRLGINSWRFRAGRWRARC
jgi:putative MATE family efflux protein